MTQSPGASRKSVSRDDTSDVELLRRIVEKDRAALARLYDRYYGPLLRFIERITGDAESAQEGVNDVMLVIWRSASKFRGESKVSTWIMGIAYRHGMKLRGRLRNWLNRFKAANSDESIERNASWNVPIDGLISAELLERAMQQLSAKHRAVVELTYFCGHSYEEIADILGCPVNTVKTRMFHARAKLRDHLSALGGDD